VSEVSAAWQAPELSDSEPYEDKGKPKSPKEILSATVFECRQPKTLWSKFSSAEGEILQVPDCSFCPSVHKNSCTIEKEQFRMLLNWIIDLEFSPTKRV